MKEGWTKNTIKGICCKLFAGGDVPKEEFSKAKTEKYYIPIYANGIENNGLYGYTNVAKVNESAITISARGTIGYISIRKEPFYPVVRLITLIPDLNDINLDFLYYSLLFIDFSHSGTSIPQLTVPMIKDIEIAYPSLSEQQRIVSRLDAAFAYIDELKLNAEKQLSEARVLFQKALTKAMEPKEGWEERKLPDISENLDSMRKPVTKKDRTEGIYPYYGASGIVDYVDGYIFDEDLLCISEDGANLLMRTYPIAFPISGKVWVNNHAHVLRFKCLATQKYVEYYFASIKLDEYITGAAQPKLTQKALNNIVINIPDSTEEQQRIVSRLDAISAHIRELEEVLQKTIVECDVLKQALLRKVFE